MDEPGLTAEELSSFERDGFVVVRGAIAPEELADLRRDTDRMRQTRTEGGDRLYARDPLSGENVLHRIDHVQCHAEAFWRLWGHPRLLAIGRAIQGPDALVLAQALVLKTPGYGVAVGWHRDPGRCPVRHGCNLGVYLDDADAENGQLWVVPGSHRRRTFADLGAAIERHGFELPGAIPVATRAGDVIVHSENVLHGSMAVRSIRERRVVYVGVRCAQDHIARGLSDEWVHGTARVMLAAVAERAASTIGAEERPFTWRPSRPEWSPGPGPYGTIERRLGGTDAAPLGPELAFADEVDVAAG